MSERDRRAEDHEGLLFGEDYEAVLADVVGRVLPPIGAMSPAPACPSLPTRDGKTVFQPSKVLRMRISAEFRDLEDARDIALLVVEECVRQSVRIPEALSWNRECHVADSSEIWVNGDGCGARWIMGNVEIEDSLYDWKRMLADRLVTALAARARDAPEVPR